MVDVPASRAVTPRFSHQGSRYRRMFEQPHDARKQRIGHLAETAHLLTPIDANSLHYTSRSAVILRSATRRRCLHAELAAQRVLGRSNPRSKRSRSAHRRSFGPDRSFGRERQGRDRDATADVSACACGNVTIVEARDEAVLSGRATSQTLARGLRLLDILAAEPEALPISKLALMLGSAADRVSAALHARDFHLVRATRRATTNSAPASRASHADSRRPCNARPRRTRRARASVHGDRDADRAGRRPCLRARVGRTQERRVSRRVQARIARSDQSRRRRSRDSRRSTRLPGERAAIAQARKRGYALSRAEVVAGSSALAAPIVSGDGHVWGSLSILFAAITSTNRASAALIAATRRVAAALDR